VVLVAIVARTALVHLGMRSGTAPSVDTRRQPVVRITRSAEPGDGWPAEASGLRLGCHAQQIRHCETES
jgi:hypothetical protein